VLAKIKPHDLQRAAASRVILVIVHYLDTPRRCLENRDGAFLFQAAVRGFGDLVVPVGSESIHAMTSASSHRVARSVTFLGLGNCPSLESW